MSTYYIYKVTNKKNQKSYIGRTENFGRRVSQHISHMNSEKSEFHNALKKHGLDSFVWEVIKITNNYKKSIECEKKAIELYDTIFPNGYNVTFNNGGAPIVKNIVGLTLEGEFVKKYDYLSKVIEDGFNIHSVKRSLISDTNHAKNHIFMFEDDYIKNGAKKYIVKENKQEKKIIQCDLKGNFICEHKSIAEAARVTQSSRTSIINVLKHKYKSANGYIFVYENEFPINDISLYKKRGKGVKVCQIDPKTEEVLNVFDSFTDAGKHLGVSYKNIQKVADNSNRTAYGYKWIRQ